MDQRNFHKSLNLCEYKGISIRFTDSVMANKINTLVVSMTKAAVIRNNFVIKCVLLSDLTDCH